MKNRFKSFFISALLVFAVYSFIQSTLHLLEHGFSYRFLGRLIVALGIASLFIHILILRDIPRTKANLPLRTAIITLGFLISLIGGGIYENNDLLGSSPSFILFIGWLAYIFWYSRLEKHSHQLKIGKPLPDFILEDTEKKLVSSNSFMGKSAIFLFYRGNWCPFCVAQIKELAAHYKELEKRNVQLVLISSQPHHFSQSMAKKFDISFQFLVDVDNKLAKQLGIFHKNSLPAGMQLLGYKNDSAMPTVIITDANGTVIFADVTDNYRVRPEPETFIKILDGVY